MLPIAFNIVKYDKFINVNEIEHSFDWKNRDVCINKYYNVAQYII